MKLDLSLTYEPERIISIVCPSRSGSTIVKHALSLHPDICSLAGEEEPYYKLAHNGWPWHPSDEFHVPNNPELIRTCIANELHNYEWINNRRWLQENDIEERPFVEPKSCRVTGTLLLKTPQNCYRRGVLELLYPRAKIDYVVLLRERPAIINGLIDGWESEDFNARPIGPHPSSPNMWWKFDMPPGWPAYAADKLVNVARFQCDSAIRFCRAHYGGSPIYHYEDFCAHWRGFTTSLWGDLGLPNWEVSLADVTLPTLGATDTNGPGRWRDKRPWLGERPWLEEEEV